MEQPAPDPLSIPSLENLHILLDKHGDQLQAIQRTVDAAPTISPEFKKTIQWLLLSDVLYIRCLYDWFSEDKWPMQFIAWAARNLFELEIWTRFVLRKREYAERFAKDWIMDGIGILECMQQTLVVPGKRCQPDAQKDLEKLYTMRDAQLPGERRFLDSRQFIAELGMKERYDQLNPVFSKLVHPTSWSVHWKQELLDKKNMRGFIIAKGALSSMNVITAISEHMTAHGLEPV
jgi:hypothetical protein